MNRKKEVNVPKGSSLLPQLAIPVPVAYAHVLSSLSSLLESPSPPLEES